ncbi:PEP-CTERM bacterial domain protein [Rhodopirellula sallentina SM41]|uniref:PEP-CTERM bacterial domain protein n=2 Tax=Rhodopirellula TaxID=265488 RepID=M5U7Z9_9BACT|nr:PEP-CTERM bacterial domain protein [Rhodopirellula sallentina SM41]
MDLAPVGGTLTNWQANAAIEDSSFQIGAAGNPSNIIGIGGSSDSLGVGDGLGVNVGQQVTLGTLTFNASNDGVLEFLNGVDINGPNPPPVFQEVEYSGIGGTSDPITFVFDPSSPALTATAVPEPSSLAALGVLGLVSGAIRRRRKAAKA